MNSWNFNDLTYLFIIFDFRAYTMNGFRDWMYQRRGVDGLTPQFISGVETFCDWAFTAQNEDQICCPCKKCDCDWPPRDRETVKLHLYRKGFRLGYQIWDRHGEGYGQQGVTYDIGGAGPSSAHVDEPDNTFQNDRDFVHDWFPDHS